MEDQITLREWELLEIDKLKDGDPDQLSLLFQLLLPTVRTLARRHSPPGGFTQDEIRDAPQDILTKIFSSLHKYDHPVSGSPSEEAKRFYSWCYTVALNLLRSKARSERRRRLHEVPTGLANDLRGLEEKTTTSKPSAVEASLSLKEVLEVVPLKDREVLELWLQGYSTREIASLLPKTSHVSVSKRITTALKKMRSHLEGIEGKPGLREGGTLDVRFDKKDLAS